MLQAGMPILSATVKLVPKDSVTFRGISTGGMLVDLATGDYYELNRVGAKLWRSMASGETVAGAIHAIQVEYDAAPEVVESDAQRLFEELLDRGLVGTVVVGSRPSLSVAR